MGLWCYRWPQQSKEFVTNNYLKINVTLWLETLLLPCLIKAQFIAQIPFQLSNLRHCFSLKYASFNLTVVPTISWYMYIASTYWHTCCCFHPLTKSSDQKQSSKRCKKQHQQHWSNKHPVHCILCISCSKYIYCRSFVSTTSESRCFIPARIAKQNLVSKNWEVQNIVTVSNYC